jgi:hypothetical protein
MSYAAMVNKAGNIVQPTTANVQSAMNDFIETVHRGLHYWLSRFLYCVCACVRVCVCACVRVCMIVYVGDA